MTNNKTFGEQFQSLRENKGLSPMDFIKRYIGNDKDETLSASYITKIELHNQIPSPKFIFKSTEVLNCKSEELIKFAKRDKIDDYKKNLNKKYRRALERYNKKYQKIS